MYVLSRRHAILAAAGAGALIQGCTTAAAHRDSSPRHYVLVHGAWHGAWAWQRLTPLLRQAGHSVSAPTLSGLGERSHLAAGVCGLQVHVQDITSHLFMEDLREVVLVGHSYAGCVVSGVLAARTGRVSHAVYLDAFVPMQGQAMASFVPPAVKAHFEQLAAQNALEPPPPVESWGERWGVREPALLAWAGARTTPQATRSFVETVQGNPMAESIRRSYLKCTQNPNPGFKAVAAAIRKDARFHYAEVDGHHNIMMLDPTRLAAALLTLG